MKIQNHFFSTFVLMISLGAIITNGQTTATVRVQCSDGESINNALKHSPRAENLIVEIRGMCSENAVVTRDRVTLRGTNPANDGIQAVRNATEMDAALWVRGAHQVTVENLKFTGGSAGLLATNASTSNLRAVNCRFEGNSPDGVALEYSLFQAEDSVFTSNGNGNAWVNNSRFECTRCTISDPVGSGPFGSFRANLVAHRSNVIIKESSLTNGEIQLGFGSFAGITDSTVDALAPNVSISSNLSIIVLTRVQVGGRMNFTQANSATLWGVTQTRSETPNFVDDNSFVKIGNASPATGGPQNIPSVLFGFNFSNFSNGSLLQSSQITGNFNCTSGGNAFCQNALNISGTSNCGLCVKP